MAYPSLYDYCVKCLGYNESQAYRRISALRLMNVIPEVKDQITEESLLWARSPRPKHSLGVRESSVDKSFPWRRKK